MCVQYVYCKANKSYVVNGTDGRIVGSHIRKARKESKVTQAELATRLQVLGIDIDRSTISKLQGGRRPVSDIETAAIAKVLEVSISWLFEEANDFSTLTET